MKEIVKLREKPMKDGGKSLYLDCYRNGRRTFEFLKMYILPGTDSRTKAVNRATYEAARAIQHTRMAEIEKGEAHMLGSRRDESRTLADYIRRYAEGYHDENSSQRAQLRIIANRIESSGTMDGSLASLTEDNVARFVSWIRKRYKPSTVMVTFTRVRTMLERARLEGLIAVNPADTMRTSDRPRKAETARPFLSVDEVRLLADTPLARHSQVRQAFLFSCFTGLRISDIRVLKWSDIKGGRITVSQRKTGSEVSIPLSDNARRWLPERKGELVFGEVAATTHTCLNRTVRNWARKAGIEENVTFHVSRHTCATLLLTYGADIYTVSRILGHSSVSTTQIYAKVVDEKKVRAVDSVPKI